MRPRSIKARTSLAIQSRQTAPPTRPKQVKLPDYLEKKQPSKKRFLVPYYIDLLESAGAPESEIDWVTFSKLPWHIRLMVVAMVQCAWWKKYWFYVLTTVTILILFSTLTKFNYCHATLLLGRVLEVSMCGIVGGGLSGVN